MATNPVAKIFGEQVRALRMAKRLTQEKLGQRAGLDPKHVGAIERGVKTSSFDAVHRLAKALGVEYYQLFLPTTKLTGAVESEIAAMLKDGSRIDTKNVTDFLKELRAAVRRLQRN